MARKRPRQCNKVSVCLSAYALCITLVPQQNTNQPSSAYDRALTAEHWCHDTRGKSIEIVGLLRVTVLSFR